MVTKHKAPPLPPVKKIRPTVERWRLSTRTPLPLHLWQFSKEKPPLCSTVCFSISGQGSQLRSGSRSDEKSKAEKRLPRLRWGCTGRFSLPTFAFTSTPVQKLQASLCGFCFTFTFASGSRELEEGTVVPLARSSMALLSSSYLTASPYIYAGKTLNHITL